MVWLVFAIATTAGASPFDCSEHSCSVRDGCSKCCLDYIAQQNLCSTCVRQHCPAIADDALARLAHTRRHSAASPFAANGPFSHDGAQPSAGAAPGGIEGGGGGGAPHCLAMFHPNAQQAIGAWLQAGQRGQGRRLLERTMSAAAVTACCVLSRAAAAARMVHTIARLRHCYSRSAPAARSISHFASGAHACCTLTSTTGISSSAGRRYSNCMTSVANAHTMFEQHVMPNWRKCVTLSALEAAGSAGASAGASASEEATTALQAGGRSPQGKRAAMAKLDLGCRAAIAGATWTAVHLLHAAKYMYQQAGNDPAQGASPTARQFVHVCDAWKGRVRKGSVVPGKLWRKEYLVRTMHTVPRAPASTPAPTTESGDTVQTGEGDDDDADSARTDLDILSAVRDVDEARGSHRLRRRLARGRARPATLGAALTQEVPGVPLEASVPPHVCTEALLDWGFQHMSMTHSC